MAVQSSLSLPHTATYSNSPSLYKYALRNFYPLSLVRQHYFIIVQEIVIRKRERRGWGMRRVDKIFATLNRRRRKEKISQRHAAQLFRKGGGKMRTALREKPSQSLCALSFRNFIQILFICLSVCFFAFSSQ